MIIGKMKKLNFNSLFITLGISLLVAVFSLGVFSKTAYAVPVGAPQITGGANMNADIDEQNPVDGLEITGTSEDPVTLLLNVDHGSLSFTTTTGLTFPDGDSGSLIFATGSISDLNTALATLQFSDTRARTVKFSAAIVEYGEYFNPTNGHIYESLPGTNELDQINGADALTEAATKTKYESNGYLATITSTDEEKFIDRTINEGNWIGAGDSTTEGDWKWISGPESGTSFWSGRSNGSAVSDRYSYWDRGEPNNQGGGVDEDCAMKYEGRRWNDLNCQNQLLNRFLVEYGAPSDLPDVSHTEFDITTTMPTGDTTHIDDCSDLVTIDEDEAAFRYDDLILDNDIDCTGVSLSPLFSSGDNDFRGTFTSDEGVHTISNLFLDYEGNYAVGLFAFTTYASISDVNISSSSVINGGNCAGSFVGVATDTDIENISSSATVNVGNSSGGLVGCYYADHNSNTFKDSDFTGSINAYGEVGGIIGYAEASNQATLTVRNNTFDGDMLSDYNSGGIIGSLYMEDSSTTDIVLNNNESQISQEGSNAGGIIGYAENQDDSQANLTDNENANSVTANQSAGGLVGEFNINDQGQVQLTDEYNNGQISVDGEQAGGLVGYLYMDEAGSNFDIFDSANDGHIVGGYTAGGMIGYFDLDDSEIRPTLTNVANNGEVEAYSQAGGLIGRGENFDIVDSTVDAPISVYSDDDYDNSDRAGGVAGRCRGCTVESTDVSGSVEGMYEIGGIFGRLDFDVNYSADDDGNEQVVLNRGQIIDSSFIGTISGNEDVGGLVGESNGGLIQRSYAEVQVDGRTRLDSGHYDEELEQWVVGDYETPSYAIGGLVGRSDDSNYEIYIPETDDYDNYYVPTEILQSYTTGSVSGNDTIGGLVGENVTSYIKDSYAINQIFPTEDGYDTIGGLVGYMEDTTDEGDGDVMAPDMQAGIVNSYTASEFMETDGPDTGGLVGVVMSGSVTNSFWDTETTGMDTSAGGTGKSSADMKKIATYTDDTTVGLTESWDFKDIWGIYSDINDGYPCLNWQDNDCDPNDPNVDNDGVTTAIENAGPNNGDANGDGILDSRQNNVTAVPYKDGKYVVVETSCDSNYNVLSGMESSQHADAGYNYPAGLVSFVGRDCGDVGSEATIDLYFYGDFDVNALAARKWDSAAAYTTIKDVAISQTTIGGQKVTHVTYKVVDGGELDQDGAADGNIVDPVGLGVSAVDSPNTGFLRQ